MIATDTAHTPPSTIPATGCWKESNILMDEIILEDENEDSRNSPERVVSQTATTELSQQQHHQLQSLCPLQQASQGDVVPSKNQIPASDTTQQPNQDKYQQFYDFNDENPEHEDFMKKFYESTVDGPCQAVLPTCHVSIEDQLDLFSHCRQPLAFLSFFREHNSREGVGVEILPHGAYVVPTFCEYCGAAHTSQCRQRHTGCGTATTAGGTIAAANQHVQHKEEPYCERPVLYFQKKRPPFCKPDPAIWCPETENYIPPKRAEIVEERHTSWMSGLFGGVGGGSSNGGASRGGGALSVVTGTMV